MPKTNIQARDKIFQIVKTKYRGAYPNVPLLVDALISEHDIVANSKKSQASWDICFVYLGYFRKGPIFRKKAVAKKVWYTVTFDSMMQSRFTVLILVTDWISGIYQIAH